MLAAVRQAGGAQLVTVAPIPHTAPIDPEAALEIPRAVKRHLGLDSERSWVVLDEFNQFVWPGYDVRPIARGDGGYSYGLLPPKFFAMMMQTVASLRRHPPAHAA